MEGPSPQPSPKVERANLGADLVIPLLALGFALYFFHAISGLAWEAKANGVIIGSILVFLVAIQLVRTGLAVKRGGRLGMDPLWQPREALVKRVGMVMVTVAFIATIKWLGLTLGLFLGMATALWIMGVRRIGVILGVSFAVAASAYLLFLVALDSSYPRGPIERALTALFT